MIVIFDDNKEKYSLFIILTYTRVTEQCQSFNFSRTPRGGVPVIASYPLSKHSLQELCHSIHFSRGYLLLFLNRDVNEFYFVRCVKYLNGIFRFFLYATNVLYNLFYRSVEINLLVITTDYHGLKGLATKP